MQIALNLWGKRFGFFSGNLPNLLTVGITNETEDTMFVPFFDYDKCNYGVICKDILRLKELFGICTFIVTVTDEKEINTKTSIETIGNYNVFGLCKLRFKEFKEVLQHSRCDDIYRNEFIGSFHKRSWVLRVSDKVDEKGNINRPTQKLKAVFHFNMKCKYDHSKAHYDFYKKYFGIPNLNPPIKFDKGKEIEFIHYQTRRK